MVFDNGVFWNGGVHWISPTGASLCFDVKKEQFRTMPRLPILENRGCRRFRIIRGGFAFPEVVRNYMDPDYMNSYAFVMLHLVREGNNEESLLLVHLPGKILTYNIPADQSKRYGSLQYGCLDAYEFIETLAPV
ncbi:hypothetical protein ACJRO7_003469 [Eucalyptus globulus]|uniref:F-box associated domain-containing protein n=1 Tax=Eucalyptus globulus TaxID=34317 RepID=A0ABD3IU81_EUCGL